MEKSIKCPECGAAIELDEVLTSQLREQLRKEASADLAKRRKELDKRESDLHDKEKGLDVARQEIQQEVQAHLEKARGEIAAEAQREAGEKVAGELGELREQLADTKRKLDDSQKVEVNLRKERRDLEDQKRELELTVNRRLDEEREVIRQKAREEVVEERRLKEGEKDKLIGDLRKQIADLQRKSEQGSQQAQGEVMELDLEGLLSEGFPSDAVEPVPKGVHGGDVMQRVRDEAGRDCGTILWESKHTKNWNDAWLPKLRDDQRAARAEFAVIVTASMPKGVSTFGCIDGVWVASRACALGVGMALRISLVEVSRARRSQDGQQTKLGLVYNYLAGPQFRQRVEALVESFTTMKRDLDAEKRAMQRLWAKREKELERAVGGAVGLHGDLSGIMGPAILEIEAVDQLALPEAVPDEGVDAPRGFSVPS